MGLLDRLFGRRGPEPQERYAPPPSRSAAPGTEDDRAVERYRYLLRTAPPEQIEQAHAEAFAKLTPEQRRQVLHELSTEDPSTPASDDPRSLARSATRAEMRQPGTLERTFGGRGAGGFGGGYGAGGLGMGGVIGGTLLASVAGAFIGTAVADALLPDDLGNDQWGDDQAGDQQAGDEQGYDDGGYEDAGGDVGGDFGGGDFGGGDFGGDIDV